ESHKFASVLTKGSPDGAKPPPADTFPRAQGERTLDPEEQSASAYRPVAAWNSVGAPCAIELRLVSRVGGPLWVHRRRRNSPSKPKSDNSRANRQARARTPTRGRPRG